MATKAIIFDCFGVLVSDALEVMVADLRTGNPAVADAITKTVIRANQGLITAESSSENIAKLLAITSEEYRRRVATGEVKNTELLDYILKLRQTYKIGLLSNIGKGSLKRRFSDDEIAAYFDAVVASAEVGFAKPEARAYEIVAERLGVRLDECVFVDDRQGYCDGAKAVGMQTILFTSTARCKRALEAMLSVHAGS